MKKAFFFLLLMTATTICFAQYDSTVVSATQTDYLRKSKNQKTAAWILLGTGTAVVMTGMAKVTSNLLNPLNGEQIDDSNSGDALVIIGTSAMVASIPLFIAASRNKRKAISLAIKNEYSEQIRKSSVVHKVVPSLSLRIGL